MLRNKLQSLQGMGRNTRPTEDHKDKGHKNGHCNRTACQSPNSVTWYNHSTRLYYCPSCANTLNMVNADWAPTKFGHALCTNEE